MIGSLRYDLWPEIERPKTFPSLVRFDIVSVRKHIRKR